jgi:hypothetical protein
MQQPTTKPPVYLGTILSLARNGPYDVSLVITTKGTYTIDLDPGLLSVGQEVTFSNGQYKIGSHFAKGKEGLI